MPRQYTVATPSIAPRSAQSGLFNQSLSVRVNLRVSGGICKASWRLAVQPCLPNGVAYSRQRATRCFAHSLGPWHHGSGRRVAPNNSFKPNLLRYGKSVAEKACHAFASTTQVGLTQALAGARVGFSTLSSVTKPRIKGISCVVNFCQEQITTAIARAACRPGPSATRIGSGCNRTKSDQRLVSQLTIRSSRVRFAASALAL